MNNINNVEEEKINSIEDLISAATGEEIDEESTIGKFRKGIKEIALKELEESTHEKAIKAGLEYINLVGFPVSPESLSLIDVKEVQEIKALCFYRDQENVRLAAIDPLDKKVQKKLSELKKNYFFQKAETYLISENSLNYALELYKNLPKIREFKWGVEITGKDLKKFEKEIKDISSLRKIINDVNITDVNTLIIATALKINSSDIHIEAGENNIVVRLRVDGVLQDVASINKDKWKRITSRMKVLAKVKINISDKPQDGRFTIFLEKSKVDVRISFLPTSYGESVVMRLLKSDVSSLDLRKLGLRKQVLDILEKEIAKPNGLILTVGPTGSGKTTTLYASLNQLNQPGIKIVTLEDPVEYSLEGINQSQVNESKGYTFAKGLRSILRQDPDIIMIGEIRDLETAEIAIQSSLTGHLVLSTLHTNDSAGVIPRLLDLGVKPFLLTPSINAIMGQRLVRKLCPHCKVEHTLDEKEKEKIRKILAVISPKANINIPAELPHTYEAKEGGCSKCNNAGYSGRTGIYEIFTMDNKLKELTTDGVPAFKILEQAIENGMITMLQDGVLKALDGITSLQEVYTSIGKMEYVDALYNIVTSKTIGRGIKIKTNDLVAAKEIAKDYAGSKELISNYQTSDMLNIIIASAIETTASDIHIDPTESGVTIRYRIDGFLHDIATLGKEYYIPLLGKIKDLSGFATNVKKATYDGRFSIFMPESRMDCRVSIITGGYGETAVLRILSNQAKNLKLKDLGINNKTFEIISNDITKSKGIIVNTGPTGSGKTTTLYAALNKLNKPDVKIITIEDPIEYSLEGIMQTQVDEQGGYTFATAIKSLMRQNPNIIMVGEIRDKDTAKVAIEASMTGHLVLSTIHANSAAGSIARFVDLGIERSLLSNSLESTIGQRLVRKICPHCKEKIELKSEAQNHVQEILKTIDKSSGLVVPTDLTFYHGAGCPECGGIGYKGRVGLFEAIEMSPEIRKLIQIENTLDDDIEKLALTQGFIPIAQDGILKALNGETTMEEIFRVIK